MKVLTEVRQRVETAHVLTSKKIKLRLQSAVVYTRWNSAYLRTFSNTLSKLLHRLQIPIAFAIFV